MDFQKALTEEKKRLNDSISDLNKQQAELDTQISKLQLELDAISAYENTKKGKPTRKTRGTSVKAQILALVKTQPMTRGEIIEKLGCSDNKGKQQTVSNTLSQLKNKDEKISLTDGVYSPT